MTRSRALGRCVLLLLAIGLLSIGVAVPVAGAAGAAGSGNALQDDGATTGDVDVTVDVAELDGTPGSHHWEGQTVRIEGFAPYESVTFTHAAGFRQRTADETGALVADTSQWLDGIWSVSANESGTEATFVLREQTLEATVEPTAAAESAKLTVDSNRVDYDVVVDADGLAAADLAAVVEGGSVTDGQFRLHVDNGTREVVVDAAALQVRDYEFEVAATDADAGDATSLSVTSELRIGEHEPRPHENSSVLLDVTGDGSVGQGDVATFFQRQHRSAWKRPALFDFSRNGAVTHGDVVVLADYVATGQLPAEPDAEFVGGPFSEEAGDVAEIPVDVSSAGSSAYVTLRSTTVEGVIVVPLHSLEGDTATLQVNTVNLSDQSATTFTAESADVGTVEYAEKPADGTPWMGDLAQVWPGGYEFDLRAYAHDPTGEDRSADDRTRLSLTERSTDDLTTYVAPSGTLEGTVENASDLLDDATASDALTREDILLVEANASGLYGYLQADASSYNGTAGLGELAFTFATEEETPVGTQEHTEDLADVDGAELVVDEDEDRFVVAVPAGEIEFSDYVGEFGAGDSVDVSFEVGPDNPYVTGDEPERVTDSVAFEPAIEFVDGPYAEQEGDVAEIPVAVDSADGTADYAWVTVSAVDHDYAATVRLEDVDGETTIEANTFRMGHDEAAGAFSGEDVVGVTESGAYADLAADERFQDGAEFRLETHATEPSDGASADDESELTLEDRSTDDLTTYVAPAGTLDDGVENASDLLQHATRRDTVAEGDLLIAEVEASGVYGSLNETTGFASHEGVGFTVTHERENVFGNVREHTADLGNLSHAALVVDEVNDRFLVVLPTDGLTVDGEEVEYGTDIDLSFAVGADSPYVLDGEAETADASVTFVEPSVEFVAEHGHDENGRLRLEKAENSDIAVETNVAPGSTGSVYVVLPFGTGNADFVVPENGTIRESFDFGSTEPGTIVLVDVFLSSTETVTEGEIMHDEPAPTFVANGTVDSSGVVVGENVTIEAGVENQGNASGNASIEIEANYGHETVATRTVELEPGETWTDTFQYTAQRLSEERDNVHWRVDTQHDDVSGTLTIEESAS